MQQHPCIPHRPQQLPIRLTLSRQLQAALAKAKVVLDNFNTLLQQHDADPRILTLLSTQEAMTSWRSRLSLQQIFLNRALKRDEGKSISTYLSILNQTCHWKFDHALIIKLHQIIGRQKKYRKKQNWIGPKEKSIEEAYFLPPAPSELLSLIQNLITYWHQSEREPLLQLALVFAQFLIIHPFMDGNGRTARMLIPLFLYQKGLLNQPVFFLSHYIKKHRLAYFQNLYDITSEQRWNRWIQFFLKGIIQQGNYNLKEAKRILHLYETIKKQLSLQWSAKKMERILLFLFQYPIFTQDSCVPRLSRSPTQAKHIIDFLLSHEIVKRKRIGGRSCLIFFDLIRKQTT